MTSRRQRSFVLQKFRRQLAVHDRSRDCARLQGMEALEPRLCLSAIGPFARIVQPTAVLSGSESRVVSGVPTDQFRSVGIIGDRFGGFCSGTLITPRDVATAAHCAVGINAPDGRFSVEGTTYATTSIHVHPSYNDFTLNNDIAVFRLSRPITNIEPSPIFRGTPRVGQILTLVGYGAGGTGASGHTGDFGTKRVGLTPIDGVQDKLITWRFDDETESNTAPGDSGGAAFLDVNGQYHLAGITSGGDRWDAGFGDNSFDTRVDSFADWIDATTDSEAEGSTASDETDEQTTGTEETTVDQTTETDETLDDQNDQPIDKPEPPPLADDDHVDSLGTEATEIVLEDGTGIGQGVLEQPGDRDVFQIVIAESGTFVIGATSTDGRLDTYLRISDATGNVIAENDDFGGTYNSQVRMDLEPGQYFIDVGAYADWGIGDYRVDLQILDSGSTPVSETELVTLNSTGGARLGDEIVVAGEGRSYTFEATVTGRMTVRTKRLSASMDTMLTAYDANGYELAFNDDWRGLKSRVRFMVQAGETYRIEVSGYGDSVGSYRLALRTKELSDSFFLPGLAAFNPVVAPAAETTASEELETLEAAVDSTIDQIAVELNDSAADALWNEAEQVVESTGDWWAAISSDIEHYLSEVLDFELDWDSWFVNSWF
ncbi:MAG: trypsin-like serine protease [Pirellulaceae bacterium]